MIEDVRCEMSAEGFKSAGYKLVDILSEYIENLEKFPVTPEIEPGSIKERIPISPPQSGEEMENIFEEMEKTIFPALTHWNHPGFMAYFNSTSSAAGIFAEFAAATMNANGMLWKTSPISTEMEIAMMGWLREALALPSEFWGIIYDTASTSTLHAIAAAREEAFPDIRRKGYQSGTLKPIIYASPHAHSSIEKGVITLGLGLESIRRVECDNEFRMKADVLREMIKKDKKDGNNPFCVIATVGTTSMTSIDPIEEIGEICEEEKIWLHVDAAHAGMAAMLPEMQYIFKGINKADSVVINPHKWMFIPVDLSAFYTRKPDILKRAFSVVREYLVTSYDGEVENLMDYGFQLGRRFRSLKLWYVFKYFGVEGIQKLIREHIRLGKDFEGWVEKEEYLQKMAPVHFSTVCFRLYKKGVETEVLNDINKNLFVKINSGGEVFLSHTMIDGNYVIRLSISGLRSSERYLDIAKNKIKKSIEELINEL